MLVQQLQATPVSQKRCWARTAKAFCRTRWLSDEAITESFKLFRDVDGNRVPDSVLLLEAGTSQLLSQGTESDNETLVNSLQGVDSYTSGIVHRDLFMCPINDSQTGTCDSGSHWSLLAAWKEAKNCFKCVHLDSLGIGENEKHEASPPCCCAVIWTSCSHGAPGMCKAKKWL